MLKKLKKQIRDFTHNIVYYGIDSFYRANRSTCFDNVKLASSKLPRISFDYDDVERNPLLVNKYTPVINTNERKKYYMDNYGLMDYHINFFNKLTSCINLSDKVVLEIGGSNYPVELVIQESGAKKWVCVDKPWIYNLQAKDAHFKKISIFNFGEITLDNALNDNDFVLFNNYAENITEDFFDKFDICVSNCAFEHIRMLPVVLDMIFHSLKKEGILFTEFAPFWSNICGNHLWINDEQCSINLTHNNYPDELHHAHLLMGYAEAYKYLEKNYGTNAAKKYTFHFKNPDHMNNLFYEDYIFLMHQTVFERKSVSPQYCYNVKDEIMKALQIMYPGYRAFDVGGVVLQAIK